ncbi:MAG TPA: hypothetical protein VN859_08565 [Steroidobacteraceae bacterium]|nr:hypothetical protein [Steroidobacteraceae bacterium]
MAGSSEAKLLQPYRPLRLLLRLAVASLAVLLLARACALPAVGQLLPAMRTELSALDPDLSIRSLSLIREDSGTVVRLRANLLHPIQVGERTAYPVGWGTGTEGGYEVMLGARGVLQAALLLLILVLAWPLRTPGELGMRLLVALPLCAVLIGLDAPLDLLGNFQHIVATGADPEQFIPMFAWARFLEGGGSLALALAAAGITIRSADRSAS